jgi:uncharacterized membrane protein
MIVFLIHLVCCAWMTGLIWVIQLLHYPAFAKIKKSEFIAFHATHTGLITFLVGPVMSVELLTGITLIKTSDFHPIFIGNFVLLVGIWICTAVLSVPAHDRLSSGQDLRRIDWLVRTNWPRTLFWSLRLVGFIVYFCNQLHFH